MYSCHYPINHTFAVTGSISNPIEYTITYNNATIYNGKVYPKNAIDPVTIDISNVCREYLETYYENIDLQNVSLVGLPVVDNHTTIGVFTVVSEDNTGGSDIPYTVMYNYNSDYISVYPDAMNINDPVYLEVDPRQLIPVCGYNYGGSDSYSYQVNELPAVSSSLSTNVFHVYPVNLDKLGVVAGDKITVTNNGESYTYTVKAPCRNRYAVYYVNKLGGLDTILCNGNVEEGFNNESTSVRLYNDRLNRKDFERQPIHIETEKQYRLYLNGIKDEGSQKIDNFLGSPKIWIHDLEKETITSCYMVDTSKSVLRFRPNKIYNYEFTIKESQKHLRK